MPGPQRVATADFYLPVYLGLGAGRSIRRVHEIVRAMGVNVTVKTIERHSARNNWVERARQFDEETQQAVQAITTDQVLSNEARQVQLGRLFQEAAIVEIQRRQRMNLEPDSLSSIARIGEAGFRIERTASGQATEIRQVLVDAYSVFTGPAVDLYMVAMEAVRHTYEQYGVTDEVAHASAFNAGAAIFGPGLDTMVRDHFTRLGIRDVVIGNAPSAETHEDIDGDE